MHVMCWIVCITLNVGDTFRQVDELEAKLKEVEGVCSPIISKMYQAGGAPEGGAPGAGGGFPGTGGASSGPTVEEVD